MIKPIRLQQMTAHPWGWLAYGFGSGLAPKAPGTCGTLAAIPIYLLLTALPLPLYGLVVGVFAVAGVYICGWAAEQLAVPDHPGIVWDEIVGFLLTMWLVPFSWPALVLGCALFRVFDIVKPWPIGWVDRRVAGGLGIMLDDVIAAVFACVVLRLILSGYSAWFAA